MKTNCPNCGQFVNNENGYYLPKHHGNLDDGGELALFCNHLCAAKHKYKTIGKRLDDIKSMFAFYGFVSCPLTDVELCNLIDRGIDNDGIYSYGCDINAGFTPNDIDHLYTN